MKRPLMDRIQDRLWRELGQRLAREAPIPSGQEGNPASISGDMPWAKVCHGLATGTLDSRDFRRLRAVKNVVETVGLSDARFYAGRIREWGRDWLENERVASVDDWGNPVRCPRLLLGTARPFSPTTLRYLATALWLKRSGKLTGNPDIVEIGVGFGGLAAMNAIVSNSRTRLVDLPQVEETALRMLAETGLQEHALAGPDTMPSPVPLVISNYAFTELNTELQDAYLEKYLKHARHGMIVSNANVFARTIGGRSDEELVTWLRGSGVPVTLDAQNDLLSPTDRLGGVRLIHW